MCIAVLLAVLDRSRAHAVARLAMIKDDTDVYALPPPAYVARASLGYTDAVAALLWASTLYQYGERVGRNMRFPFATQYVRTIIFLEPAFRPAYRFIDTFVTMQVASPDHGELEATRDILRQGVEEFPYDPDIWGAYASFMLYDAIPLLPEDERSAWKVEGAIAAENAVERGFTLRTMNFVGAIVLEKMGHQDLAIAQLERAYAVAPNDETRQQISARLVRLQGSVAVERAQGLLRLLSQARDRVAPYLGEGSIVLLGPPRKAWSCAGHVLDDPACDPSWDGAIAAMKTIEP